MNNVRSHDLFTRAQALMPGGVNSPVRAFKSVGGEPFFVQRADGPYLFDADGNRYIDYVGSWGPMIAGHAHPQVLDGQGLAAVEVAQGVVQPLVAHLSAVERVQRVAEPPDQAAVRMLTDQATAIGRPGAFPNGRPLDSIPTRVRLAAWVRGLLM